MNDLSVVVSLMMALAVVVIAGCRADKMLPGVTRLRVLAQVVVLALGGVGAALLHALRSPFDLSVLLGAVLVYLLLGAYRWAHGAPEDSSRPPEPDPVPQRERGGMRTWLMWAGGAASAVLMLLMMLTPRHVQAQARALEAPPAVSYWDPAARGKVWRVSGLGSGCAVWWYRNGTYGGWVMGEAAVDLQHWTLEQASKLAAAVDGRDSAALVAMRDRPVADLADALRPCLAAAVMPPGPWVVRSSGAAADGTRPIYTVTGDPAGATRLGATLPGRALAGEPCDCARLRVVTASSTYCPPRYAPIWPMAALCEALP